MGDSFRLGNQKPKKSCQENEPNLSLTPFSAMLPSTVRYRVLHHASKSNLDLQIADYCTWAIYRKWNGQDARSFQRVQPAVRREWDVLQTGTGFPD
jgi:hypothetical protein